MNTPPNYHSIYRIAHDIEAGIYKPHLSLTLTEQIQDLVSLLRTIAPDHLDCMPNVERILMHSNNMVDWDEDVITDWPSEVIQSLEGSDKQYQYRHDGEHWEVFGVNYASQEEWAATCEAEMMASILVESLNSREKTYTSNLDDNKNRVASL